MVDYCCEAYEGNDGTLFLVALEETGEELRPVWGATYYGERDRNGYTGEEYAGMDWVGLIVQGLDPVREGWEGLSPEDLARDYYGSSWRQIADSSDAESLPLGVDLDRCGEAGKLFAIAAGAAYRCPECGETLPTVRDVHYPNSWTVPDRCECCEADLTGLDD